MKKMTRLLVVQSCKTSGPRCSQQPSGTGGGDVACSVMHLTWPSRLANRPVWAHTNGLQNPLVLTRRCDDAGVCADAAAHEPALSRHQRSAHGSGTSTPFEMVYSTENDSNQGQILAVTVLRVPNWLDSGGLWLCYMSQRSRVVSDLHMVQVQAPPREMRQQKKFYLKSKAGIWR